MNLASQPCHHVEKQLLASQCQDFLDLVSPPPREKCFVFSTWVLMWAIFLDSESTNIIFSSVQKMSCLSRNWLAVPPLGPFWRKVENGSMFEKKTRENYLLENNCTIRCPDHLVCPEKGPRGGTMGTLTTQKKKFLTSYYTEVTLF